MPRICALCGKPPREGDVMRPVRIKEPDLLHTLAKEVGLYSVCEECCQEHKFRYAARVGKEPQQVTNDELC